MTKEQFAEILKGRQYRDEISREESLLAKQHGLVVCFGASDDLLEFRGAIYDEIGAWDGTRAYINKSGCLIDDDDMHVLRNHNPVTKFTHVDAAWCPDGEFKGYSWLITANIPCASFNIMEDEKPYCRGIVFDVKDLI